MNSLITAYFFLLKIAIQILYMAWSRNADFYIYIFINTLDWIIKLLQLFL